MFTILRAVVGIAAGLYIWYDVLSTGGFLSIEGLANPGNGVLLVVALLVCAGLASLAPADVMEEMFGEPPMFSVVLTLFVAGGVAVLAVIASLPEPMSMELSVGSVLYGLVVWIPSLFIGLFLIVTLPFGIGVAFASVIPVCVFGAIAVFTTSNTLEITKQHARLKLPSDEIERRIAEAMQSDIASDEQVVRFIHQLPMLSRLKYTFLYKVRKHKYERVVQVLRAQEEMIREQTITAKTSHSLERARRAKWDDGTVREPEPAEPVREADEVEPEQNVKKKRRRRRKKRTPKTEPTTPTKPIGVYYRRDRPLTESERADLKLRLQRAKEEAGLSERERWQRAGEDMARWQREKKEESEHERSEKSEAPRKRFKRGDRKRGERGD